MFYPGLSMRDYFSRRCRYLGRALRKHGYEVGFWRIRRSLVEARRLANLIRRKTLMEINLLGEVVIFLHELGIEAGEELLRDLSTAFLRPYYTYTRPAPGLEEFLSRAAEAGLRLAVVSNTLSGRATKNILKRYGLLRYFSALSFSDEVGFLKPHPKIYRNALRKLKASPKEAIMVGDERGDILGALNLGMSAIQYVGFRVEEVGLDVPIADSLNGVWRLVRKSLR